MNRAAGILVLLLAGWSLYAATAGRTPSAVAAAAEEDSYDRFPHDSHVDLFLDCSSCHGVETDGPVFTVTHEKCARCHNDDAMPEIEWAPPEPQATVFNFDHADHLPYEDTDIDCVDCHGDPDSDDPLMDNLVRLQPGRCMDCHDLGDHFAEDNDCSDCHLPLHDQPAWTVATIAAMPRPEFHEDMDFLNQHRDLARDDDGRCAVCHAQESCERCHLNASAIPEIMALGRDDRVAQVVSAEAGLWTRPANHDNIDWEKHHGTEALESSASCANCHSRQGCENCHGMQTPPRILAVFAHLHEPDPTTGIDNVLQEAYPPVHEDDYATNHSVAGATADPNCAACPSKTSCEDCHQAMSSPRFHAFNYVTRHAADSYGRDQNCASCHSPEVFCRSCHLDAGLSQRDPKGNAYHDRRGDWLLGHAVAARQTMETCQSCHQQTDCMRCHSERGWGVNPHGPGFDAERLRDRNDIMCMQCHPSGAPR